MCRAILSPLTITLVAPLMVVGLSAFVAASSDGVADIIPAGQTRQPGTKAPLFHNPVRTVRMRGRDRGPSGNVGGD